MDTDRWVLLEPVGSIGNRLAAIASARLLANDLRRELVLDWRLTPECCCPWERLVGTTHNLRLLRGRGRVPRTEEPVAGYCWGSTGALTCASEADGDEPEEPALCAGAELLRLWGLVRKSAKHDDLLRLGLERLNSRHLALFRHGHAHLLDVNSTRWKAVRRFLDTGAIYRVLGNEEVACICVRASDFFYPPNFKEREHMAVVKELSHGLRTLNFTVAVRERVMDVVPGTIALHVPLATCNRARHAFSPVQLLEMELQAFSSRNVILITDDPAVEEHFQRLYGKRLKVSCRRVQSRLQPEFIEDSVTELLTLGRCDRLFGTIGCVDLRVAAVMSGRQMSVDTVFYEPEDSFGEAEVSLADPVQPRGPFFLAGSWNDWKDFVQLMPSTNASDLAYSVTITVRQAPGFEEFQIVQNRTWEQRFYPSSTGAEILGPDDKHGSNWRVKIPAGSPHLRVLWDPRGARSFTWRYVGRSGFEWNEEADDDTRLLRNSPYSVAGTWDNWKTFKDLVPTSAGEPTYSCKIRVRKGAGAEEEEFQVFKDRDWRQRFYPSGQSLGSEVQGPDKTHAVNWQVALPKDCRYLYVTWDPRGDKSVDWSFLDKDSAVMPSPVNRSGPFYIIGSWDWWDTMTMMSPVANSHRVCVATVPVNPDNNILGYEEFQILQDRDLNQAFYPSFFNMRRVLGPDDKYKKGQNWRVRIRPQYRYLQVTFSPFRRFVDWRFIGQDGEAVATERLRRSAPDVIGDWAILCELGRGWAGGVVYKAKYGAPHEEHTDGEDEGQSMTDLVRLIVRNPYLTGTERAKLSAGDRGLWQMAAEHAAAEKSGAPLANPGTSLLRAIYHDGLLGNAEVAQLVAVHSDLCDAFFAQPLPSMPTASLCALSAFCRAFAACSPGRVPDEASHQEHGAEEGVAAADASGGASNQEESEPRGDYDDLFDVMDEHTAAVEAERLACAGKVSPERQWQLYGIMHHGSFTSGSLATLALCSRNAALTAASVQGLMAQAAVAGQPPPSVVQAARAQPRPALGTVAAVKSPLPLQEIRMLKRLQGIDGVPAILDVGLGPESQFYCAMPLLGPSLDELLTRCNHDGLGGRFSWPVARALGARMVQVLRDIHRRGVVHCDMKPANVIVGLRDATVYIIDCGLAGRVGATYFKNVGGTLPYNSIKAGFPGLRMPADDLESVGWVLLRCVLGQLPWEKRSPGVSHNEPDSWRKRSEGMSLMKEWFLEDPGVFGEETDHCPAELMDYLFGTQRLGLLGTADAGHLARWFNSSERWSRFVDSVDASERGCERSWKTRTLHMAPQGSVVWRPSPDDVRSERVLEVPAGLKVRTTGVRSLSSDGFEWMEVDPVWMPRSPLPFQEDSWLLVANERETLLVPTEYNSTGPRKART